MQRTKLIKCSFDSIALALFEVKTTLLNHYPHFFSLKRETDHFSRQLNKKQREKERRFSDWVPLKSWNLIEWTATTSQSCGGSLDQESPARCSAPGGGSGSTLSFVALLRSLFSTTSLVSKNFISRFSTPRKFWLNIFTEQFWLHAAHILC